MSPRIAIAQHLSVSKKGVFRIVLEPTWGVDHQSYVCNSEVYPLARLMLVQHFGNIVSLRLQWLLKCHDPY